MTRPPSEGQQSPPLRGSGGHFHSHLKGLLALTVTFWAMAGMYMAFTSSPRTLLLGPEGFQLLIVGQRRDAPEAMALEATAAATSRVRHNNSISTNTSTPTTPTLPPPPQPATEQLEEAEGVGDGCMPVPPTQPYPGPALALSAEELQPFDLSFQPPCTSDYWAVLTDQHQPVVPCVESLLAAHPHSCIVIVALGPDNTTSSATATAPPLPSHLVSTKRVVYLGPEEQEALPYGVIRELPWTHISRKNVGYLYAIHGGAKYVLDTEASLRHLPGISPGSAPFSTLRGPQVYPVDTIFNPYAITSLDPPPWPRGMTSSDYARPQTTDKNGQIIGGRPPATVVTARANIQVLSSLIDGYPDLATPQLYDLPEPLAPFRTLTWSLPRHTFVPYNSLATLHRTKAFFGLLLPSSTPTAMTDTIRGFITQRLLWEVGGYMGLTTAWGQREDIPALSAQQKDGLPGEQRCHDSKLQAVMTYLGEDWVPTGKALPEAMDEIYRHLYDRGIIQERDVEVNRAWIRDLHRVGYQLPEVPPLIPQDTIDASLHSERFAIGAQGKAESVIEWAEMAGSVQGVDFFLLSFDQPIESQACNHPHVTCLFGLKTSWASGRNLLAKAMLLAEEGRQTAAEETGGGEAAPYKYWILADGDIRDLRCPGCDEPSDATCRAFCFNDFIQQYLAGPDKNFPILAFQTTNMKCDPDWEINETCEADAMMNAFHRQVVPFALPYVTDLDHYDFSLAPSMNFYLYTLCLEADHPVIEISTCHYHIAHPEHSKYPKARGVLTREEKARKRRETLQAHLDAVGLALPPSEALRCRSKPQKLFATQATTTWYSRNGRRWWEGYEPRLCTDRFQGRFGSLKAYAVEA